MPKSVNTEISAVIKDGDTQFDKKVPVHYAQINFILIIGSNNRHLRKSIIQFLFFNLDCKRCKKDKTVSKLKQIAPQEGVYAITFNGQS